MATDLQHLPNLPDAGYATRRQKETSDAIMIFMRACERNRPLLLAVVIDGVEKWRTTAGRIWRGLLIDRDILDSIFRYFVMQAGPNPAEQLLILNGMAAKEQQAVSWDRRETSKRALDKALRSSLADLRKEQKKH